MNVIPVSILLSVRQRITILRVYLASLSDISETLNSLILFVFFVSFSCPICSEVFVLLARFDTLITSVASDLLQGIADVVYPRKFCKFLALIARAKPGICKIFGDAQHQLFLVANRMQQK